MCYDLQKVGIGERTSIKIYRDCLLVNETQRPKKSLDESQKVGARTFGAFEREACKDAIAQHFFAENSSLNNYWLSIKHEQSHGSRKMFKLVTIKDTILVPAHLFGVPRLTALEHMVNKRFSDRVIPGHGLCVALWDFVRVGEDRLVVQTGESSTRCIFRLVVFCPFEGEVVFGTISASHKSGIFVQMAFFDAVHIAKDKLPRPSEYDEKESVWIWRPDITPDGDDEPIEGAAQTLYMDVTNECVFRVERCDFENRRRIKPTERDTDVNTSAMSVTGALYDAVLEDNQGLGDPLWWYEGEEGEEGAEDEVGEANGEGASGQDGYEEEGSRESSGEGQYEEWQEGDGQGGYEQNGELGEDEDEYDEIGGEDMGDDDDD